MSTSLMYRFLKRIVRNDAITADSPEIYGTRLIYLTLAAGLGAIGVGFHHELPASIMSTPAFMARFNADRSMTESIMLPMDVATTYYMAGFLGALLSIPGASRLGRRGAILVASIITFIGDIMEFAAWGQLAVFFIGRFISGVGIGVLTVILPIYIAEHSPRAIRGMLVSTYSVFLMFGIWLSSWVTYGNYENTPRNSDGFWIMPLVVQTIPLIFLLLAMSFCTDTPQSLILRGKSGKADYVLSRTRNLDISHHSLRDELSSMEAHCNGDKKNDNIVSVLKTPTHRNRLLIGTMLSIFEVLATPISATANLPFVYFAATSFSVPRVLLLTSVLPEGLALITLLIFALFIIDGIGGRRRSLLWSIPVQAASLIVVGSLRARTSRGDMDLGTLRDLKHVELVFIHLCLVANAAGLAAVPTVYVAEIPDSNVRVLTAGVAGAVKWLFYMGLFRALPYMMTYIGQHGDGYGTSFIFAGFSIAAWFFVKLFVRETQGVSLASMRAVFDKSSSTAASDDVEHEATASKDGETDGGSSRRSSEISAKESETARVRQDGKY